VRRLLRRLFSACVAGSFVLLVAVLLAWVVGLAPYHASRATAGGRYWQFDAYRDRSYAFFDAHRGIACTVVQGWPADRPWRTADMTHLHVYPREKSFMINVQRMSDGGPDLVWWPESQRRLGPLMLEAGTCRRTTFVETSPGAGTYTLVPAGPALRYLAWDVRYWGLALLTAILPLGIAARAAIRLTRWMRRSWLQRRDAPGFDVVVGGAHPTGASPPASSKPGKMKKG
jgi:hypothetical protein